MPDIVNRIRDMKRPSTVVKELNSAIQTTPAKGIKAKISRTASTIGFLCGQEANLRTRVAKILEVLQRLTRIRRSGRASCRFPSGLRGGSARTSVRDVGCAQTRECRPKPPPDTVHRAPPFLRNWHSGCGNVAAPGPRRAAATGLPPRAIR